MTDTLEVSDPARLSLSVVPGIGQYDVRQEEWRQVDGFPHYEVSDLGRVRSSYGKSLRVLKSNDNKKGGIFFIFMRSGVRNVKYLHRLVLEAFVGPCPLGMECCHNNGDYRDNALSNLRWGTKSSNMLDKIKHGTHHEVNKETCSRGHLLQIPNLVPAKLRKGWRECISCTRARDYMRYHGFNGNYDALADEYYKRITWN